MIISLAAAEAAQTVVENATDPMSVGRVLIAAGLAAVAMSSVVIGAWLGLTFKASEKLIANILAFGSGALVNALAVDLAFGTTQHLVNEHLSNLTAWGIVAGGFFTGGLVYFSCNRLVAHYGGAARHKTTARAYALERKREEAKALLDRLGKNAVLRSLPPSEIDGLLPYIRDFKLESGKELFHQGEAGDAMYLIDHGRLGVFIEAAGATQEVKRIAEIKEGDIVGEMALLGGGTRSATVTAETDVDGMRIEKEDFDHLLHESPQMKTAVKQLAELRTLDSIKQQANMLDSEAWAKMATQSIRQMSAGEVEQALAEHGGGSPLAIWIGNILDAIPGSLVIGATFVGFAKFNPTLLISVFLANLPEAMASANTMRQAGYSKLKIYTLWGSLVLIGAVCAAVGNIVLPTAPVAVLGLCEAIAGGAILALVAQVMFPHAYEEGGDVVSLSTIGGFTVAFLLTALDIIPHAH
jgi:CRP-like cAMP-binding protein